MSILLTILWVVAFILVISFATKLNRNPIIWGIVALVFSPLLAALVLWFIGKRYG